MTKIRQTKFRQTNTLLCFGVRVSVTVRLRIRVKVRVKGVSAHFLEKWRHFVNPKTLLCFSVRVRVRT